MSRGDLVIRIDGRVARWVGGALILLAPATLLASTVTIPNTFSNGTTADATKVNANFAALAAAVNDNASQVSAHAADTSDPHGTLAITTGTWTPVPNNSLTRFGAGSSGRYATVAGITYFSVELANVGGDSDTGKVAVKSLPFSCKEKYYLTIGRYSKLALVDGENLGADVNGTLIEIYRNANGAVGGSDELRNAQLPSADNAILFMGGMCRTS